MGKWIGLLMLLLALGPAMAVEPSERLSDPAMELRARELSEQLRCMVCQNQNIDSSDAQLAKDLRILVRERISAGDSDQQVLDYLVSRYGDFVLLNPRFAGAGAVLWVLPPLLLIIGAAGVWLAMRRRQSAPTPDERQLSAEEEALVSSLINQGEKVSRD